MDGLHSDAVLTCSTALHSHLTATGDIDNAVKSVSRLGDHFQRSPAAWRSGVSPLVGDDARLLPAVTDPESARWSSAGAPVLDQFGSRPETRSSGKLETEQMDWQVKGPMGDFHVLQAGSDVPSRTHENDQHQWAVQNDGVLYSSFGTTQKGHHLPTPSSSRTTGSLDSASSTGFAASTANCTNGLLLRPDTIQDTGKVCNDWSFADIKHEKSSYRLSSANGGTEYASPKASIINESRCSSAAANKRASCEEPADPHQVGGSRGTGGSVSSSRPAKKHRIVAPGIPRCQVEGCRRDLTDAKEYHRRHKVCEDHAKAPKIIADGIEQRFCQQCSRFHALGEFDDAKKSCRKRLAGHNERRRKSCQDAPALSVVSMLQDGGRHLDRSFFMQHPMALPLSVYQNGDTTRVWSRAFELKDPVAMAGRGAQLLSGEHHSVPLSYTEADRQLTILQAYKGAARPPPLKYLQCSSLAESFPMVASSSSSSSSQGPSVLAGLMEAAASSVATPPGSHPGLLDSGRALSLLSSQALVGKPLDENGAPPLQQLTIEHSSVSQSTFPTFTDNPQKLLTLPSSQKTIGLSICTSASVSEKQVQHKKPLMSNLQAAYSDALLAQLLEKHEFRSLGGASSNHAAKPTLDLMNFKSQTNHGQFASSHDMQARSAQLVQYLQSLRDSDGSSVLNVNPKLM